jgi:4-hydroxy-tetrahydrodipicolinate synthase
MPTPPAPARIRGVLSPVVTPFRPDLSPDAERFVRHCQWLLASGCAGLAVFGTNSEANSLSAEERMVLLEQLVQAGIPAPKLVPGTGCCALTDTVRLSAHATALGCAGVLMLPPFYYKGVSDEGVYRSFAETIERVGDSRLAVYLYHIPPVSQVPVTFAVIERLLDRYAGTVAGIKDSSGDWANTQALNERFGARGFDVFAGSETFLLRNMRAGGAGCITAGANVNPGPIDRLYRTWHAADAEAQQAAIDAVRAALQKFPMIAALKATIAQFANDRDWRTVRPPLVELTPAQEQELATSLAALGFTMPGISAR